MTLCGRADSQAAYKVSLDVRSPLFTDADRNGNGQVGRKDFCAETRDAVVRWPRRLHGDLGGDGVSSELVPGQGGMPDAIRFTVRVAALERAVGEALPRDGSRTVFVWAHSRPQDARATPYAYAPDRRVVDRLPVPDLSDGCALPQAAGEALAVTLTDPSTQTFDYTGGQQTYTVPQGGYGQSWCLASSSGLVLGLLNGFAVAEVHALDHLGEALRAVQPAPVPLGGLGELEGHGERGLA